MRQARRPVGAILWTALLLAASPAAALDEADRATTRSVIERQIEAFRRDDAAGAYAFASPAIQQIFPSDERFLEMVRKGYPPVYRPRSFEFGEVRETEKGVDRLLRIQDEAGVDWDAVYSLERQPDGSWRISGCALVKRPGDNV